MLSNEDIELAQGLVGQITDAIGEVGTTDMTTDIVDELEKTNSFLERIAQALENIHADMPS